MEISVIIPTYNRAEILKKCVNALFEQTYSPEKYEIIIIDDGSTDKTSDTINNLISGAPINIIYKKQPNKGPAAARNMGIKHASGKIVYFTGDDIIATQNLLEEHMRWHEANPQENIAVLGYVTWSPDLKISPFMYWLENGGPQFCYHKITMKKEVNYRYFYTCNVSLKKKYLMENGLFDEEFQYAAFEDTELAYRLMKKGLRIFYNKKAVGYHYHPVILKDKCKQMIKAGKSAAILRRKIPELSTNQRYNLLKTILRIVTFNKAIACFAGIFGNWLESRAIFNPLFNYLMSYYFYQGLKKYPSCPS